MNDTNLFVDRIDDLLKNQKKNRSNLYNDLNIPKNLIGQWKQRGTIPSADIACKIAKYLNTTVEYLVTGNDKSPFESENRQLKLKLEQIAKILNDK